MTDAPDSELLARLRAADPASSLPAADPTRVADLLEAVMSDSTTHPTQAPERGTHGRSPLTWIVAAASIALIAATVVLGLANRGGDTHPSAAGSVTQLGYRSLAGRCLPPSAAVLQRQPVAFRGTLTSLDGGTARFEVTRWYAGGPTDAATVVAPPAQLSGLVQSAHLQVGEDYLVSATGGTVTSCGFTGPAQGHLQKLYDQAFAG